MYHCRKGLDGKDVRAEHSIQMRQKQKDIVVPRGQRRQP
jgi:hypothetical protein